MENLTIGQKIASRRKLANLSQEAVAEQLGVSRQSISKWESDAGLPDIDNLIALGKIFNVSVGWLLGTEKDPSFDPSTGLSEAQLRMVEKIVSKKRPSKWLKYLNIAVSICFLAVICIFSWKISSISRDSISKEEQISILEEQISSLEQKVNATNDIIAQQKDRDSLLLDVIAKPILSDDEETVTIRFYLFPKLYQENAQSYVVIQNDNIFEKIQIKCVPKGSLYYCSATLPLKNGYSYSFALAGDSGFQEQRLDNDIFTKYLENLYDSTRYHLDMSATPRTEWNVTESLYTFNQPIASPFINFANHYVGYEAVDIILYHNDTPIYTESLRQAFIDHGGVYMRSELPFVPNIQTELPALSAGDSLRLEICTKHYNGKTLSCVLEDLRVINN